MIHFTEFNGQAMPKDSGLWHSFPSSGSESLSHILKCSLSSCLFDSDVSLFRTKSLEEGKEALAHFL